MCKQIFKSFSGLHGNSNPMKNNYYFYVADKEIDTRGLSNMLWKDNALESINMLYYMTKIFYLCV